MQAVLVSDYQSEQRLQKVLDSGYRVQLTAACELGVLVFLEKPQMEAAVGEERPLLSLWQSVASVN